MSSAVQPRVSILTPVYNGEKFIRECIESVLAQTYENWEYCILDNASTDDTAAIIEQYVGRDPRIRVTRNATLLPIAENHNAMMRLISPDADYCKPLMADDWMLPECVEKLVAAAEYDRSIGLVCALAFDGKNVLWDGWPYPATRVSGRDVARAHLLNDDLYVFGSPTSALLRGDLVRSRPEFFNPDNIARDYESCLDVLQSSDFAFVHQVLTFQRMHEGSVTSVHAAYEGGFVGRLLALAKWGPHFLTPQEYRDRSRSRMRMYYHLMASHVLGAGPDFWRYHREQLAKMGARLDRWALTREVVKWLASRIASPLNLLRRIAWRFT